MRSYFWKFVICLAPCLLAGWVTANAVAKYMNGEPGGFKLGVDLVGGTILVYEIDTRKQLEQNKKYDPLENTRLLAESLKRRIDPNDLYNITIRPAGGEARVEIILPTGGVYRAQKAEKAWNDLVADLTDKMEKKYKKYNLELKNLDVGRGKILELAERTHLAIGEKIWAKQLFGTDKTWKNFLQRFWDAVPDQWPALLDPDAGSVAALIGEFGSAPAITGGLFYDSAVSNNQIRKRRIDKAPVGNFKEFTNLVLRELGGGSSEKVIETWIKDQAWEQLLIRVKEQWPRLKDLFLSKEKERLNPAKRVFGVPIILTDNTEELVGFIQTNGNLFGEAALASVEN